MTIMFSAVLFAPFFCVYRKESYLVTFASFARSKTPLPPLGDFITGYGLPSWSLRQHLE